MNHWLVKSDAETYSAHDLERDGRTEWDGVRNPTALRHIRAMSEGDVVFIYHSGKEKAIVAMARAASDPRSDARDKSGKLSVVDLAFDEWLKSPVTLAAIKADPFFADFDLVRLSRLSVMPVSAAQWKRILAMAGTPG
jgi:predicted RNA-binding protein with PUA-like domain